MSSQQPQPTFGPMIASELLGIETPTWVEVEGRRFPWNEEQGAYEGLYIEPIDNDGTLGPDSYYEIED